MEKIKYKEDEQGNKKVIIKTDPETDEVKVSCGCCACGGCGTFFDVMEKNQITSFSVKVSYGDREKTEIINIPENLCTFGAAVEIEPMECGDVGFLANLNFFLYKADPEDNKCKIGIVLNAGSINSDDKTCDPEEFLGQNLSSITYTQLDSLIGSEEECIECGSKYPTGGGVVFWSGGYDGESSFAGCNIFEHFGDDEREPVLREPKEEVVTITIS